MSYPISKEAEEAEIALERLKGILTDNFPPAMPRVRLEGLPASFATDRLLVPAVSMRQWRSNSAD